MDQLYSHADLKYEGGEECEEDIGGRY
jgi:hypothetical protein